MTDTWKCERDWQGPSDDECVDDLLVVSCVRRVPPHVGHDVHVGIIEGEAPAGAGMPVRPVFWASGTGDLYDCATGIVYRRQFAPAP